MCSNFWPEPTGIAIYSTDLADSLKATGHSVTVLTNLPHYPWWRTPDEFSHIVEGKSERHGVLLFRAKHYVPPKMNAMSRARFEYSIWWNLRRVSRIFRSGKYDLILGFIPTVAVGIIGMNVAKKFGIPFGLIVQDLSGAGAKQSGLRGGVVLTRLAHFIESKVIRGAEKLVVVSPAMRDVIMRLGLPQSRVTQIMNYSAKAISIIDKESARVKLGWESEEFIVLHTGNMGAKQDLQNVVRAADILQVGSKIRIYLVGHGHQEHFLKELCDGKNNVSLLPAVSDVDYSALLAAADLLLVNERHTQMEMSLPSKLTSYLYSERPILAAVPRGGATWRFLDGMAEMVEAGDPLALARKIEELSNQREKLAELASKGKEFADANLSPEIGRKKYVDWVEGLIKRK